MSRANHVIVGKDDQFGDEYPVALIRPPKENDGDQGGWYAWVRNANNGPRIAVRSERASILITETMEGGESKIYTFLHRNPDGTWFYSTGVAMSIEDGWLEMGSSSSRGKVVFQSDTILDRALENIKTRNVDGPIGR